MARAVFTTKPRPTYDDLPEVRYHFPRTYLNQAAAALGDWIVYYEPRRPSADASSRGGRQAYFAVARVDAIEPDPNLTDHFFAYTRDYLEFDRVVPFKQGDNYFESILRREDGQTNKGAFGRAVRTLPDREFNSIVSAGFSSLIFEQQPLVDGDPSDQESVPFDVSRPIIEVTIMRPFREQAFRRQVRRAYDNRCAMSGLRLTNGGGRPEVHAAHIKPVASAGPDSVRNGIALSGTLHWLFDQGLLTVGDEFEIIRPSQPSEDLSRLLRPNQRLHLPEDEMLWPHPDSGHGAVFQFHADFVPKALEFLARPLK